MIYINTDTLRDVVNLFTISNTGTIHSIISKYYLTLDGELRLIWEFAKSCFGKGYWDKELPWHNDDGWLN